jgi:hypothetical protein
MFGFCAAKSWGFFLLAECGVRWHLGVGKTRRESGIWTLTRRDKNRVGLSLSGRGKEKVTYDG